MTAIDRRLRAPAQYLLTDLGDDDKVLVLPVEDTYQGADFEAACAVDVSLTRTNIEVLGQETLGALIVIALDPDLVAPSAFIERADLETILLPVVLYDPLRGSRVLQVRHAVVAHAVRDANDIAGGTAIPKKGIYRV